MQKTIKITEPNLGRIDKYLLPILNDEYFLSRTNIQKMIANGDVLVNSCPVTNKYNLNIDDEIVINFQEVKDADILPENIPLEFLYEDNDIAIVNKPNNIVVHPSAGHSSGTVVNALMFHLKDLSSINGVNRPGIVHRLDKMTTGLLIIAKNDKSHKRLTEMLSNREIYKEYVGLVRGEMEHNKGRIEAPIGRHSGDRKKMAVTEKNSKDAITNFEVIQKVTGYSLVKFVIETGRTHQIRVHMNYIGKPIVGDWVYGLKEDKNEPYGQHLHAYKLEFNHPITNKKISIISRITKEFNDKLKLLGFNGDLNV